MDPVEDIGGAMNRPPTVFAISIGVLLLCSCHPEQRTIPAGSSEVISAYLVERVGEASFGGQVFCAYEPLADSREVGGHVDVYLWVLCQEYYLSGQALEAGTGSSLPIALSLEANGDTYAIVEHRIPGEISLTEELVRAYFPHSAWRTIMPESQQEVITHNARAERLEALARERALATFGQ